MCKQGHPQTKASRRFYKAVERSKFDVVVDIYAPRDENRVFCPYCQKSKLQFQSEKQAYRYIAFNGEKIAELKGFAPIRAYYCPACGCWHTTSRPKREWNKTA